mgnify:CR=1 FL=1
MALEIRVLVVEDDPETRMLTEALLSGRKGVCLCALAKDGLEGLELVEQTRPDIVLLDLILPGMDGLDFLRTLRRRKLFRDPRDKMLGGVLSGLTHYFGLKNPLWLRLLMVILFFCSYSTILIAYAILWILIPQAQSAEDFLRMDGRDVTPESLGEQIVSNNRRESTSGQPAPPASGINQLLRFLAKALYFVLIFIGGAMLFVVALVFIAWCSAALPRHTLPDRSGSTIRPGRTHHVA